MLWSSKDKNKKEENKREDKMQNEKDKKVDNRVLKSSEDRSIDKKRSIERRAVERNSRGYLGVESTNPSRRLEQRNYRSRFDNKRVDENRFEGKKFDKNKFKNRHRGVKVIPLGGLQEIGKNCCVIEYNNEMVIVDIGLSFPDETMPGVDIVIPDFTYVKDNIEKLKAVILTHGHLDHIGAVAHFFKDIGKKDIPVYSSAFTLGLVESKLKEKFRNKKFNLKSVDNRDLIKVGKYLSIEFIRITHSIPDAFVVAIHTPEGSVVHTGDYKFDLTPVDGKHVDFFKLAELGEKGALLLLSDSTNAAKEGFTASELSVAKSFKDVFLRSKGRIIISVFSSHAHRVQEIVKLAHEFGRRVALSGRSMNSTFDIGQELRSIDIPKDVMIDLSEASSLPEEKVVIVCTGTQGEEASAMTRAAIGQHRDIRIDGGDSVVMSANSIPGNEIYINRVVNSLIKKGAKVYRHGQGGLHVSGHGCRGDIALMLNLVKPKFFMPVHGEYMHLFSSKQLAIDVGYNPDNVLLTKNGDRVVVTKDSISIEGKVVSGDVAVDNSNLNSIGTNTLKDRTTLAKEGLLVVHITLSSVSKKIAGEPSIISKGFGFPQLVKELSKEIVLKFASEPIKNILDFRQIVKDHLRKSIKRSNSKSPVIIPIVSVS